jgi:hypothetical protein
VTIKHDASESKDLYPTYEWKGESERQPLPPSQIPDFFSALKRYREKMKTNALKSDPNLKSSGSLASRLINLSRTSSPRGNGAVIQDTFILSTDT